jgi:hypothetical protein
VAVLDGTQTTETVDLVGVPAGINRAALELLIRDMMVEPVELPVMSEPAVVVAALGQMATSDPQLVAGTAVLV